VINEEELYEKKLDAEKNVFRRVKPMWIILTQHMHSHCPGIGEPCTAGLHVTVILSPG